MNFNRILIGSKIGTLTGFLKNIERGLFGLSAFHVLTGGDMVIDLHKDVVKVINVKTGVDIYLGRTISGCYSQGMGNYGNYGLMDFAIFEIEKNDIREAINQQLVPIKASKFLHTDFHDMQRKKVYGYSEMDKQTCIGNIYTIHHNGKVDRYDVLIQLEEGTLSEGDSGMLWKDEHGDAVFMHVRGNKKIHFKVSYATIITRITDKLNMKLYETQAEITINLLVV